jgi:transcriptional antiterminator NusG
VNGENEQPDAVSEGLPVNGGAPADAAAAEPVAAAEPAPEAEAAPARAATALAEKAEKPEKKSKKKKEEPGPSKALAAAAAGEVTLSASGEPMNWYILKVQSNREDSIADALRRKVKIENLEHYFGEIIVPTEKVTEFNPKTNKKRIVKRKLYPGYIVVQMVINDDTWYLVRDTHGIGDFTGAGGKPVPMLAHEVAKIVGQTENPNIEAPKVVIGFKPGSRVKIIEGTFQNFEGEVDAIDEAHGLVTVMINIFGRPTPVELKYWQAEAL